MVTNPDTSFISLGSLTPGTFLQQYWQKKPLLVRNAMPGFQGLLSHKELIQLAGNDDVQSRLVIQKDGQWLLKHGPLNSRDFPNSTENTWSFLVQDVNHWLPSANNLLLKFGFIPYARLDDLMVSYAPTGGGIGPHYDSYDVFLLQGFGRRRWEIAANYDNQLVPDAPVKILQHFNAEQSWILEPGDMLYLPPNYAHHGIAVDACMTYSIGFRAPSHQELIDQFLMYLQDHQETDGWYCDPDLKRQAHPWEIHRDMLQQTRQILKKIKWNAADVESFLGIYLTEPKAHVFFNQPKRPLSFDAFNSAIHKKNFRLSLKSRMLTGRRQIFLNGESYTVSPATKKVLSTLVCHQKNSFNDKLNDESRKILYQWYVSGFIKIASHT
ncbi:50S ribosomal protein L16 3-hydroxylase [Nitrosomonas sp. Nm51]|uniref:cupin domain-containing protein n=1 Tax=Nitrosomonas sp. Nm51 TaxID=133720 RepID=UPI0008D8A078|nr:cupin domain-containing protein [Nitrosomonas sp. Nm51]SER36283.1 50S ribosomal protein L16 3-hydroxylase [Nitrosomonas sp. Nm51]